MKRTKKIGPGPGRPEIHHFKVGCFEQKLGKRSRYIEGMFFKIQSDIYSIYSKFLPFVILVTSLRDHSFLWVEGGAGGFFNYL